MGVNPGETLATIPWIDLPLELLVILLDWRLQIVKVCNNMLVDQILLRPKKRSGHISFA
jgi:hypothetical protein